MDYTYSKSLVALAIASTLLTACNTVDEQNANFDPHYVEDAQQDLADKHYWSLDNRGRYTMYKYLEAKFLQSQSDMDKLRQENASLKQEVAMLNNSYNLDTLESNANAERALSFTQSTQQVRHQINSTIADLDAQIALLRNQTTTSQAKKPTHTPIIVTATTLKTHTQNDFESSTLTATKGSSFDVAFTFSDKDPWENSWNMLDEMGEVEKWRGYNPQKDVYFIYMGSYVSPSDATTRREEIIEKTGVTPVLIKRHSS